MTYTPTFLIKKEDFDKAFKKISERVSNYFSNKRYFYEWKQSETKKLISKNREMILKFGSGINEDKLKKECEKEVEDSDEYKKKVNTLLKEDSLCGCFEYHEEDNFLEIESHKYYLINTEVSSQAMELKDFCMNNSITYTTTY